MRKVTTLWITIAGLCASLTAGCSALDPPSHVAKHFGEALQLNGAAMIANPEAGSAPPPEGLDPGAAQRVVNRYYKTAEQQSVRDERTFILSE
jgi:hypothetical protein